MEITFSNQKESNKLSLWFDKCVILPPQIIRKEVSAQKTVVNIKEEGFYISTKH